MQSCNKITFILIGFIILLSIGCEQNRYNRAEELYNQRRYAAAIEALDNYIRIGKNGALITRAELIRSSCYYELGLTAMNRKNWQMAIRLFKLSNSDASDIELATVYKNIADAAIADNDIPTAMQYLTSIIVEVPTSEHIPEALQKRIKISIEVMNDRESAWRDYMNLYDGYPNNPYELIARPFIQRFIGININEAVTKAAAGDYDAALGELFQILRYPICDVNQVNLEISNIYQTQAELKILEQDYMEADKYFRMAIQYSPSKKDMINQRLRDIATLFIKRGNNYLELRDFNSALLYYRKTFDIIPDYEEAKIAIEKLNRIQENIKKATLLSEQADKLQDAKRYPEALKVYQEAYQLDKQEYYQIKQQEMQNLIEAERNPIGFAQKIINEYKAGILSKRINAQKMELLKNYKPNEIRDSGWKILLLPGQYKYEVRYDLITPSDSYFYVWQVNLRDKSLIPLNKLSERIMQ